MATVVSVLEFDPSRSTSLQAQAIHDMTQLIELLKALSPFAWPAVALIVLFALKPEIRDFFSRLSRLKFWGAEAELGKKLDDLGASVNKASHETVQAAPMTEPANVSPNTPAVPAHEPPTQNFGDVILAEAAVSPLAAFMRLASRLERVANDLVARSEPVDKRRKYPLSEAFRRIPVEFLSADVRASILKFIQVRNLIVHESEAITNTDILRAIDIGLQLLAVVELVAITMPDDFPDSH